MKYLLFTGMAFSFVLYSSIALAGGPGLNGTWKFVPGKSTDIASWGNSLPQIEISSSDANVRVISEWLERGKIAFADTFDVHTGGGAVTSTVRSEVWPPNWFMGVLSVPGEPRTVSGSWLEPGKSLRVVSRETLRTSQGKIPVTTTFDYTLEADGKTMTCSEKRSTRPSPVVLVFERKEAAP